MPDSHLRELLLPFADPERSTKESSYLKLDDREVLGTSVPVVHKSAVQYVRTYGLPTDLRQIARWFQGSLEEALCAVEFLAVQPSHTLTTWKLTYQWCSAPDTWALADPIASILVAGHLEAGVIEEDALRDWATRDDENFWFRRIAIVATTSLNSGLGGPTRSQLKRLGRVPVIGQEPRPDFTVDLLESSVHDTRHFIRLGIGWALGDLSVVAPDHAERFVKKYRAQITKGMLTKARLDENGQRV